MAVKLLSCMSSKNLEEKLESNYVKEKTPPRSESKHDLRRFKSFTCQVLIHPPWTFMKQGTFSTEADTEENEVASPGRGWKGFLQSLQCPRTPMPDFKEMAIKLTAGAYKHSCKPCSASVYDQDASHAVHPVSSLDTNNFSLPAEAYRYPTPPNDDQLNSSHGTNQGAARGDSLNSVHTSLLDQKFNSKTSQFETPAYSNYGMVTGATGKVTEDLKNLNHNAAVGNRVPGTEWFSQVELGVFITFVTLSNGCNSLKRIRFSRDIFSKKEAESWWTENGDRVRAVYNVPAFERSSTNEQAVATSEEEASGASGYATPAYSPGVSRGTSMRDSIASQSPAVSRGASMRDASVRGASMRGPSSREALTTQPESVTDERPHGPEAHESDQGSDRTYDDTEEAAWVEEDVPGVYLTLTNLAGGGRELKRVRFSREKFTEKQAKIWWDENRGRIHKQYLSM